MNFADDKWISVDLRLPYVGQVVEVLRRNGTERITYTGIFPPWIHHWAPLQEEK